MASGKIQRRQPFIRRSIRTRLLILLLGLIFATMVVSGYITLRAFYLVEERVQQATSDAMRSQASEFLLQATVSDAQRDELVLKRMEQDASQIARYTAEIFNHPDRYLQGSPWDPEEHMRVGAEGQYLNGQDDIASVFIPNFVTVDESLLDKLRLSAHLDPVLATVYKNDPNTVAVYVGLKEEITRYYPNIGLGEVLPADFQVTQRPWYVAAAPENNPEREVVWSEVYMDATGKGLLVTVAAPIYTDQGEFIGVVGIDVSLEGIASSIERPWGVTTRYTFWIDESGQVVMEPVESGEEGTQTRIGGYSFLIDGTGQAIAMPAQAYLDVLDRPPRAGEIAPVLDDVAPVFAPILADMREGKTGVATLSLHGREVFVAYAPVGDQGWSLANVVEAHLVRQAVRVLQESVRNTIQISLQRWVLPLGVILLMATSVLGGLFAARLARPIREMAVAARQIGAGQWDAPLPPPGEDEIGVLATAMRRMKEQLQELVASLEQRVTERTADLSRRALQLEAAATVAREAAAIRDVGALLNEVVHLISDRFGFYHTGIFLVDEAREYAVLRAASSEGGRRMLERGHRLKVGEVGIVGYVAGTGESRIALDVGKDAVFFDNPDLPQTRSEMALPLRVRGEVIGVLDVQSEEPAAFTDEDVAVLQTMADQIALAIENARLLREAQERLREVNLLLGHREREAWKLLGVERAGWGYVYDGVEVLPKQKVGEPEAEPDLTMPLRTRGGPIGRLAISLPDRPLTPDEEALIQQVAEQAGLALENARLFQETQRALGEMEALYRASRAIGEATSVPEIARGAAEVAATLGFSACSLTLVTDADEQGVPVRGDVYSILLAEGEFVPISPIQDFPITDRAAAQGVLEDPDLVVIYEDAENPEAPIPDQVRETMRNMGMRGMVTLGLAVGGRPLGFLTFSSTNPLTGFAESWVRLVRTVADAVAIAVERQRLLEQTVQRAERERLLSEMTARITRSLDMDALLRTAVRELGRLPNVAEVSVHLVSSDNASDGRDL